MNHSTNIRIAKINNLITDCMVAEHITADTVTISIPPVNPTDAVTKEYVDNRPIFDWKNPVLVATTGQQTLSGLPGTVDGYPVIAGDRVLVHLQTNGVENGIYTIAAGAWPRATDMMNGTDASGAAMWVLEGTQFIHTTFVCDNLSISDNVGTDPLVFIQFSGGTGAITPGVALTLTGNLLDVNVNNINIGVDGLNTLELVNTTVTSGPYGSSTQVPTFTVDSKGRLTAAANVTITGTSPVGSTLPNTDIWVGNASNQAVAVEMIGDATIANTGVLTLANTTVTSGPYGSSTQVPTFTVDSKGRLTAAANVTLEPPIISSQFRVINIANVNTLPYSLSATEMLSTYIIVNVSSSGNLNLPSVSSLIAAIGLSNYVTNMSFPFSVVKNGNQICHIVAGTGMTSPFVVNLDVNADHVGNYILVLTSVTTATILPLGADHTI